MPAQKDSLLTIQGPTDKNEIKGINKYGKGVYYHPLRSIVVTES